MLNDELLRDRCALADAAKAFDWPRVLDLLSRYPDWVNSSRPEASSLFSPLHHAAYGGAPLPVVERLVDMGAWRTLLNARGERPIDVAERRSQLHLQSILAPRLRHLVPIGVLLMIQSHFHAVIRGRVNDLVSEQAIRLPQLEPLLEVGHAEMWFPVPGMYGGFRYRLARAGVEALLVVESWCRVAEGSGERHEIDSAGARLVAEGVV